MIRNEKTSTTLTKVDTRKEASIFPFFLSFQPRKLFYNILSIRVKIKDFKPAAIKNYKWGKE